MSSLLITSLLSQCPDIQKALDTLCWAGTSCPEIERVEAVGLLVAELQKSRSTEELRCKEEAVVWEQCLPLLVSLSVDGDRAGLVQAVCVLMGVCVRAWHPDAVHKLAAVALSVMEDRSGSNQQLSVEVAVDVMAALLSNTSCNHTLTMQFISCTLGSIKQLSNSQVYKIIMRIWLPSLKSSPDTERTDLLFRIWLDLLVWYQRERTEGVTSRLLLCLTALSDHLLSADQQPQLNCVRSQPELSKAFFKLLQAGLIHQDSMSRKRALYLLRRCVTLTEAYEADLDASMFKWRAEKGLFLKFWEDYTLVLETLEEYQIHVVRPVLTRLDLLVETAAKDIEDGGLVHPSWLLCIYQRMFQSENKTVIKEGVSHLLGLSLMQHPAFASASSPVVVGSFMDVLAEASLYHRSPGQDIGNCPELGIKLQNFMVTFFSSLPDNQRADVLLQLLKHLKSRHWCAVPLLFLSRAMSHLTPRPILKAEGLHVLRDLLRCTMNTHQSLLRRATQRFLLQTALHLFDVASVSLEEIFGFLAHFQADESLCRGTPLWEELCDWLLANEAIFCPVEVFTSNPPPRIWAHCRHRLKEYLSVPPSSDPTNSIPVTDDAESLACALLLSVDLDRRRETPGNDDSSLENLLFPLLDVLRCLNTSLYMPICKADKGLQLMLRLLQLLDQHSKTGRKKVDKVAVDLSALLFWVVEPVQEFILRRLSRELQELCDIGRAGLYLSVLKALIGTYHEVPNYFSKFQTDYVSCLTTNCLQILSEPPEQKPSIVRQVQKSVSMAALSSLCELAEQYSFDSQSNAMHSLCSLTSYFYSSSSFSLSTDGVNQTLPKPSASAVDSSRHPVDSSVLKDWGRVVANFMRDQWTCRNFLQKFANVTSDVASLEAAVEALALLPCDLVLPVFSFMSSALPQLLHEEVLCEETIVKSWKLVQALSVNAHDFWPTLKAFVHLAFHSCVLNLEQDQKCKISACIQQVKAELMELSKVKSGVFNVLIQHCCYTWIPRHLNNNTNAVFQCALHHLDIINEACLYGPLFKKDQRLLMDVQMYVEQLNEEFGDNATTSSGIRDFQFPRVCAMAFLSHLESSNDLHQRLMESLVDCLLKKDEDISKSTVRYYSNSMQHRIKNRVWQTLLLLLPKLRQKFVVERVFGAVCEAGFCCNQASVKYLIEWALILILHHNPSHLQRFWDCFDVDQEKTKTSICTFLSVLVHLDVILSKVEYKQSHWEKALEVILLWCFNHNFTVRLYALLALKRVWALKGSWVRAENEQENLGSLEGLARVVEAYLHQAELMQRNGNAKKNWSRIQDHFFFSAFNPVMDYSVETVFHTFPSLSELADDECIPVWKFEKLVDFKLTASVPLRNADRRLSTLQPGDWIQEDKGELEQDTYWVDVQKKISPWILSIQEQEPQLRAEHRAACLNKMNGLLVVASLINKAANLGGLCRTCEIFGANALVVDNLHHISDKQFQALSVSSELWLPILEVKPFELSEFLQMKKTEGYCIVGVEQTANSQSLNDYRFPEKTLLLLGNEREGIPADLLQLLDVCVEIPQQGVTRSLNVHVSAALLVWEYRRQHMSADQAS